MPIYSFFIWSCGLLSCSFVHKIFLCHLIVSNSLFLACFPHTIGSQFLLLLVSSPWWVNLVHGACVYYFLGGTDACTLGDAGSCPSDKQGWVRWCVLGWVYGLSRTSGSLSDGWGSVTVLLYSWLVGMSLQHWSPQAFGCYQVKMIPS